MGNCVTLKRGAEVGEAAILFYFFCEKMKKPGNKGKGLRRVVGGKEKG
jgi:hypothetical protein